MVRLLCTLGVLATTCGLAAGVSSPTPASLTPGVQVVGNERPLQLGSMVVTATALPANVQH